MAAGARPHAGAEEGGGVRAPTESPTERFAANEPWLNEPWLDERWFDERWLDGRRLGGRRLGGRH